MISVFGVSFRSLFKPLSQRPLTTSKKGRKKNPQIHLFEVGGVPGLVHGPDAVELVHGLVDQRDLCVFLGREDGKEMKGEDVNNRKSERERSSFFFQSRVSLPRARCL